MVKILGSSTILSEYSQLDWSYNQNLWVTGLWDGLRQTTLEPEDWQRTEEDSWETGVKSLFLGSKDCVFLKLQSWNLLTGADKSASTLTRPRERECLKVGQVKVT